MGTVKENGYSYFMWQGQILKTPRDILYCPIEKGEVCLKEVQIQAQALIAQRLIRCLCDVTDSLPLDALMLAIHDVDLRSPIDVRQILGPMKLFSMWLPDFAYAVIKHIPFENFSSTVIHSI